MIDPQLILNTYCPDYHTKQITVAGCAPFYGETSPYSKVIFLTQHWRELNPEGQRYVVLHEVCHALRPGVDGHDRKFWEMLQDMVFEEEIDPVEACLLETFAPEWYLSEYQSQAWDRAVERAS